MIQPKPIKQPRVSSSLKRTGRLKRRTRIQPLGTRGRVWKETRKGLKAEFLAAGIVTCEFRFEGCTGEHALSFAHCVKRRFIKRDAELGSPEHISTVGLACLTCHDRLDLRMSHAEMREAVMGVIANREGRHA